MKTDYDIIIIGTGAGGGTLARHLAPSGKSILLLERGDWLKREPENWSAAEVFVNNRYVSPDPWLDKSGKSFTRPAVTVKVNNTGAAKQYGIHQADIVYEEVVEGGITRLAAIFNSQAPERVGPQRQ